MLDSPRLAPVSGDKANALIVLLHGYGSNGDEMLHHAHTMRRSLPEAAFVALHAPSSRPGIPHSRQWWPLESFAPAELSEGVTTAAPSLSEFLTHELGSLGLTDDRLLLVGFSQGAMMALHVGLRRGQLLAGIIGISGILVAADRLATEARSRPPVLLIHGTEDDVVPFRWLDLGADALRAAHIPVETYVSTDVAHTIAPEGLAAAIAFAEKVLA